VSAQGDPTPQELWRLAAEETAAADAVISDPMVGDAELASEHLIDAWRFLLASQGSPISADAEIGPALAGGKLPQLPAKQRAAVAQGVTRVLAEPAAVGRRALKRHQRRLEQAVADVGADVSGWSSRRDRQIRWLGRAVLAAVALALLVAWGLAWRRALAPGMWRGTYFPAKDLTGVPIVRRDRDVDFDWREGRPMTRIREDSFSVRWDSCLQMERATTAAFQLISNNGSRLYVDGLLTVDNWDNNFTRTRGAEIDLEPGVHHLRVEYWEGTRTASITLLASLDGDPPRAIPRARLRYPVDGESPCGRPPDGGAR
jgi:hypothetical protein